jgi:hypothetical protein
MSHVAQVDIEVKNLDDLEAACRRIGLELVRGQQTYRWYGKSVGDTPLPPGFSAEELGTCEHAIRVPLALERQLQDSYGTNRPYEIGVLRRRDGQPGWALLYDEFANGMGMGDVAGRDLGRLKAAYAVVAASREARMRGFSVTEQQQPDGVVRLVLRK